MLLITSCFKPKPLEEGLLGECRMFFHLSYKIGRLKWKTKLEFTRNPESAAE
jgi:hypothetical protein